MLRGRFTPALIGLTTLAMIAGQMPAHAEDDLAYIKRGQELAQLLCARCHAIAGPGPGAEKKSPPFSTLVSTLTLEGIADQLLEGLPLGHEPMPQWQFSEQQVDDLLFYIESVSTEN